jgi:hypothetical protein
MEKNNCSAKNIRIFLILLAAFSALVLWRGFKGVESVLKVRIFAAMAAVVLFFVIIPRWFAPIYKLILRASGFVGNTIFLIISTAVFFLLLTPLALIMRLFGKVFLPSRYDKGAASYFESPPAVQGYEKQY